MKNVFLISTTNNIEKGEILSYVDVVCANVVIGTNVFSDFLASFKDFVGGRSGSYKASLQRIYNEVIQELKEKAINIGANAIVGLSVDFDEISGKDKSMFMVSAMGTAIKVKLDKCLDDSNNIDLEYVTNDILEKEVKSYIIISELKKGKEIIGAYQHFLLENPQIDLIDNTLERLLNRNTFYNEDKDFLKKYLTQLPYDLLSKKLYNLIKDVYMNERNIFNDFGVCKETFKDELIEIIEKCNLFNPKLILDVIHLDIRGLSKLLDSKKDVYNVEDLLYMKKILNLFDKLPNTGKIEMVKSGMFGKEKEKFVCECGNVNNKENEFCEKCGVNIKGLKESTVNTLNRYRVKVGVLEQLLRCK